MTRIVRRTLAGILLLFTGALAGCEDGPDGPADGGPATLTARVDGAPYTGSTPSALLTGSGTFVIASPATSESRGLTLQLFSIGRVGTYPLGVGPSIIGGTGQIVTLGAAQYITPLTAESGSVTITALSTTRIAGTFSFTGTRQTISGPEATTVTQGVFDVPVKGNGTLAISSNTGSSVTGTVRGQSFTAAAASMPIRPETGTLQFRVTQGSTVIDVEMSELLGIGTYTMGTGAARRVALSVGVDGFPSTFGGTNLGTTGTITINSISSFRVRGSMNVTLKPTFAAGSTTPAVVTLDFDLGIPSAGG